MTVASDRRGDVRFSVALRGRLVTATGQWRPCSVVNMGAGGAALRCHLPGAGGLVTLHVDGPGLDGGLGRLDGVIVAGTPGAMLHLAFTGGETLRQAIGTVLLQLQAQGRAQPLVPRRQGRISMTDFHVLRANGEKLVCTVLDISLHGICLGASARPPVGERVVAGGRAGRVVRHHDQGFAVCLLADEGQAPYPVRYYRERGIACPQVVGTREERY